MWSAINPSAVESTSCRQVRNVVTSRRDLVTPTILPIRNINLTSLPIARIVLILKVELFFADHKMRRIDLLPNVQASDMSSDLGRGKKAFVF
jgi:hypothetical protein